MLERNTQGLLLNAKEEMRIATRGYHRIPSSFLAMELDRMSSLSVCVDSIRHTFSAKVDLDDMDL